MTPPDPACEGRPSRTWRWLVSRLLHPRDREAALGDLDEEFDERAGQEGVRAARRWYRQQVLSSVLPALRRRWPAARHSRVHLGDELRWAWRGLRARRGAGLLAVGLLATALAANTVLFSVTDALVLHRFPYGDGRVVGFTLVQGASRVSPLVQRETLDDLRRRTDVFAAVHGYYAGRNAFLVGADEPQEVHYTFVTPGLVEALGVLPRWGRPLTQADAEDTVGRAALVAEDLAREWFGDPSAAVGATLPTTDRPLVVVGVMPRGFRFPDNRQRIWRPLDLGALSKSGPGGCSVIARLADGRSAAEVSAALSSAPREIFPRRSSEPGFTVEAGTPLIGSPAADQRRLFFLLLAAAAVLLLIAATNVVTLELSGAQSRLQAQAIRSALGASRASLVRVAILEGACLVAASLVVAGGLTWALLQVVAAWLPTPLSVSMSANLVDFDARAFAFMGVLVAITFAVVSVPLAILASSPRAIEVVRREPRTVSSGRARLRAALTVGQIGVAVVLLIGSVLFVRSYLALIRIDKGFDSTGVARIGVKLPPTTYASGAVTNALRDEILARLRARPDVVAVSTSAALDVNMTSGGRLEVEGGPPPTDEIWLSERHVDTDFFRTLGITVQQGRLFAPGDPPDVAIIADTLAGRLWPGMDPLGRRFRSSPDTPWLTVIGTVGRLRDTSFRPQRPRPEHPVYLPSRTGAPGTAAPFTPPPAAAPGAFEPNAPAPGPLHRAFGFLVRMDPPTRLDEVIRTIRSIDSGFVLTTEWIDDTYAATFADRALAARVVSSFGLVVFLVAIAGVYGVMTLLVSGRTREIGIRMALGADRRDIRRLVMGSTARLAMAGAALGVALAAATSNWVESQVFGVSATDPATYVIVVLSVLVAALAAAWPPARRAVRVDPTIALRAE